MGIELLELVSKIRCKRGKNVFDLLAWSITKREIEAFRNCGEVLSSHRFFISLSGLKAFRLQEANSMQGDPLEQYRTEFRSHEK